MLTGHWRNLTRGRNEISNSKNKNGPGTIAEASFQGRRRKLHQALGPVFEGVLDLSHELVSGGAVDHAMVVGQGQIDHRANRDGVVDHYRTLLDGAKAQDSDVRLVDDRQAEQAAKYAGVGDGEGAFGNFFGFQFLGTGTLGQVVHRARDAQEIFLFGVLDDWNDQAPIKRDGDADVAFLVQHDVGAVHG